MTPRFLPAFLCAAAAAFAEPDSYDSSHVYLGVSSTIVSGVAHVEAEVRLEDKLGVFAVGRTTLGQSGGSNYGGQLAVRHHFRTVGEGFFVGAFADANYFDLPWAKVSAYGVGGQWGGRWSVFQNFFVTYRLGLAYPVSITIDESSSSSDPNEQAVYGFLDEGILRPVVTAITIVDADFAIGYAF